MRKNIYLTLSLSLSILLSLFMFVYIVTYKTKSYRAEIFVSENRNSLLNKDISSNMSFERLISTDFTSIEIINPNRNTISKFGDEFEIETKGNFQILEHFTDLSFSKVIYYNTKLKQNIFLKLKFHYNVKNELSQILILWLMLSIIIFPTVGIYSKRWEDKKLLEIKNKENEAIARTTQALAHDVRKPFTMLQSLLLLMESNKGKVESNRITSEFIPEIKKSLASVNGMISDIMEVGSESKLVTELVDPYTLIENSIRDTFRYNENIDIQFQYHFNHKHQLQINSLKVLRVFSNILSNALQAMKNKGHIWFKTEEIEVNGQNMIEFCIGNDNSYIEQADFQNLFEAFFTKNKKGGTGLGLAIAKKVINSHGGKIRCESSQKTGVEFYFTLPIAGSSHASKGPKLPQNSHEVYSNSIYTKKVTEAEDSLSSTADIEAKILDLLSITKQKLHVVIVDDETIYSHLIQNFITQSLGLAEFIQFDTYENIDLAEKEILANNPDLVFMDIDLNSDINGFELSEKIRQSGFKNKICIHSNRGSFECEQEFIKSNADLMIPKPMASAQFFNLLFSIAKISKNPKLF